MTIKHLLYTQLCAFKYTKGACVVFFRFRNSPMKIFYVVETVASISDQREYYVVFVCPTLVLSTTTNSHLGVAERGRVAEKCQFF